MRIVADNVVTQFIARRNPEAALGLHNALQHGAFAPTWQYVLATYLLFVVGFFAIMAYRTFTEREPDARRRLLLLDAGAAVSLTPMLIFPRLHCRSTGAMSSDRFVIPMFALFLLFPLTMAYVIVVHRAMDVRVVVRQGVQYVLARGGIRVIQLALIVAVTIAASSLLSGGGGSSCASRSWSPDWRRSWRSAADLPIACARWVDRRFFREAYDAEQILSDLATAGADDGGDAAAAADGGAIAWPRRCTCRASRFCSTKAAGCSPRTPWVMPMFRTW